MLLTFKYRLLLSKRQHAALAAILEAQRQLYNAALEERIECYRKTGKSISFAAQCRSLTICRRDLPEMDAIRRSIQDATLKQLDLAFAAFFQRLRAGVKPGFPRFRGRDRWRSFTVREPYGFAFNGRRFWFKGVPGTLRFHEHRPLPREGGITTARLVKDGREWSICFAVEVASTTVQSEQPAVGIDLGLNSLAALSNGEIVPNVRVAKRAERQMRRHQRALARCKHGSQRRQKVKAGLGRLHQRIVNTRTTYLHQVSAQIARRHGLIAVENLNVKGLARTNIARSVHDAAWAKLKSMLAYKAERAGGLLIEVDPRFTSQDCSGCGERVPKDRAAREHSCPSCGLVLDRDVNAAKNILHKAKLGLETGNVAQWSERRSRSIGRQLPSRSRDNFSGGEKNIGERKSPSPRSSLMNGG